MADPISIFSIAAGTLLVGAIANADNREELCPQVVKSETGANKVWTEYVPCSQVQKIDPNNPTISKVKAEGESGMIGKDLKL